MKNRRIRVADFPTTTPGTVLELTVSYNEGGANYFSGTTIPRGYSMLLVPVKVKDEGNYQTRTTTAFTGIRGDIEGAKRFSAKRLQELADGIQTSDLFKRCLENVLGKSGLVLQEPVPA